MMPRGARRVRLPRNMQGELTVVFDERAIGIKVEQVSSAVVVIKSFHELSPGVPSPAASKCAIGDALLSINGQSIEFLTYKTLLQTIRASGRPLELKFTKWENDEDGLNSHPGAPSNTNTSGNDGQPPSDLENPIQQAIQMATRKRTKVYTGKNFGNHIALRKQERRCAVGIFVVLVCFMYFLYNRFASSDVNLQKQRSSNVRPSRLGINITKVDGNLVTITLNSDQGVSKLKKHFHRINEGEGEEEEEEEEGHI